MRGVKTGQESGDAEGRGDTTPTSEQPPIPVVDGEKARRKPIRRKPKTKLAESFPSYMQEAFFGRELLDAPNESDSYKSDEEISKVRLLSLFWTFIFGYINPFLYVESRTRIILHCLCKF